MKKIILIAVLASLGMSSCEEFLSTEPINKIAAVNYYTDEEGMMQGLAGIYDPLGSQWLYGNHIWLTLESATDEGYYARTNQAAGPAFYNFSTNDNNIAGLWGTLYDGANRANDLIANINLPKMDERKRQAILGEALFLRGYYYFMLVSRFGDVPMKLTPTTTAVGAFLPKTPAAQVYAQVIKDMTEAEGKVATSSSYGYASRVSKTVVQGILARVCLQMAGYPLMDSAKYTDALSWSQKVIDSGEHALNVSFDSSAAFNVFNPSDGGSTSNNAYRQIFINQARDIYNVKECMWEAEFSGNSDDGFSETGRLGNTNGITITAVGTTDFIGYGYGFIRGTGRLFNKYGVGDLRRDWVLTTFTFNGSTGAKNSILRGSGAAAANFPFSRDCGKWRREYQIARPMNKNNTPINFPILRYADVLLMYAEAAINPINASAGKVTDAIKYFNQVRRRAYGQTDLTLPNITTDFTTISLQDIKDERSRELCFEGVRKMDLIRWNVFLSTMNAVGAEMSAAPTPTNQRYGGLAGNNVTAKHLFFPIPSTEISNNKLLQQSDPWK